MKILVTGSSGFIGSHFVSVLLGKGYKVIGIDLVEDRRSNSGLCFVRADILDTENLLLVFNELKPESIIHLAARTDLNERKNLSGYIANIDGVKRIIDAVEQTTSIRRVIFTSTQLVCKIGYVPKNDMDYSPSTLYGESKVIGEKIVRSKDGGGVEWCIVRPTTIWGPWMSPHYQNFFLLISKGLYFHTGMDKLYKSYGYVGNIAEQYYQLLHAPVDQIYRRTFYLADYEPTSHREWADAFASRLGRKKIRTIPKPIAWSIAYMGDMINSLGVSSFPFNTFRLNNILTEYTFDLSRTKEVCGPMPYSMQDGVEETVKWLHTENIV